MYFDMDTYIINKFWICNVNYSIGDTVLYCETFYICKTSNTNTIPDSSNKYWIKIF